MTPQRALVLKRQATALRQQTGIKQTAALAQIARAEGFPSWPALVRAAGGADAVREAAGVDVPERRLARALKAAGRRGLLEP